MKMPVLPPSPQVGKAAIQELLKQSNSPEIQSIKHNASKAPVSFSSHSESHAVEGDLDDGLHIDFADSVFYIPPADNDDLISGDHAKHGAKKVKAAWRKSSTVQRLVVLSARLGTAFGMRLTSQ